MYLIIDFEELRIIHVCSDIVLAEEIRRSQPERDLATAIVCEYNIKPGELGFGEEA